MSEETVPDFEEFTTLVKRSYEDDLLAFTQKQKDAYFASEEAQGILHRMYDKYMRDYKDKKVGVKGFRVGAVATTAMNISMLFKLV